MSEDQGSTTAQNPATGDVVVSDTFLVIDGCKVARVEPGGVLAFPDKCRGRSQRRGCPEVRVKVTDLARVVEEGES